MANLLPSYFHLHLISDATGETLDHHGQGRRRCNTRRCGRSSTCIRWCARAKQLERVLKEVEQSPGIVLYTIVKSELIEEIERRCRELKVPCAARAAADHAGVRILSRRAADAGRGRPAHRRCRLFPPHRRAELRHGARRRPAAAGPEHGRHHHPRHLAHVQDADQHLSGPARLQDRQPAAGARHRAAAWR